MITLRKITLDNRRAIFNLEVEDHQQSYVASNLSSVASCYVLLTNGSRPFPLAIYADEEPVGFVMIIHGDTGYELPSIVDDSYCIMRLMIDKKFQNRGYGREAMTEILKFIRTFPAGPASYCWIPYEADNVHAKRLYESFGFQGNGEFTDGEPITVLKL